MKTRFLIVVTGWNCAKYVQACLDSIKAQTYTNYQVVIVDDYSTDGTFLACRKHKLHSWKLMSNIRNCGTTWSRAKAIEYSRDFDVIVWVYLDDELEPIALEKAAIEYEDPNCWLTYGNYINSYGNVLYNEDNIGIPDEVHENNSYRSFDWRFFHLRTYRKELYEKLTKKDLYPGSVPIYGDANMLYCLMELAGKEHIRSIVDVLYRYRDSNPRSLLNRFTHAARDKELAFIKAIPPKTKLLSL